MTVGLSNSWTSDLSFEISYLLIYVMTYIGGFRISVDGCAGCSQAPPRRRGCRARYTIRHTTYRCITELYLGYSSVTT